MAHLHDDSSPAPSSGKMKHTEPRTLPSSHRHSRDVSASASAAAALGWAKTRPLEPNTTPQNLISPSAARAATLAAERSPSPRGQARKPSAFPRTLRTGSPRPDLGNSAATQAYKARASHPAPQATHKDNPSLLAAQEATRPRSVSSPVLKQPVSGQASGDGSGGRGDAARQRWEVPPESGASGGGTTSSTTLPADMFTANPPVSIEVEEKKRADELQASAVAMAQNMFKQQPKLTESFLHEDDSDDASEPAHFDHHPNLHQAAYKLAQKRLAKMHDENQRNGEFQAHYGPSTSLRRRFTIGGRFRRRPSSDGDVQFPVGRTPNRTSLLGPKQPESQEAGRQADRAKVLEAAQRNVRSQLDDMDQSVADRTGMVPPSTKSAWESKARAVAQARSTAAATEESHEGQRDVGGGLYVAEEDVEAIAKQNLKPFFLELDERAEKEHERVRSAKEEKEAKKVEAEKRDAYDKDVGGIHRKLKSEQKEKEVERQKTLKEEERARKEAEKTRKEAEKAERRAARNSAIIAPGPDTGSDPARPDGTERREARPQDDSQQSAGSHRTSRNVDYGAKEQGFSPGKVKSWLRSKLTRQKPTAKDRGSSDVSRGFVGGHVLRSPEPGAEDSAPASPTGESGAAGQPGHPHLEEPRAQTPIRGESEEPPQTPLERGASPGTDDSFEDARENTTPQQTPPRVIGAVNPGASPTRDSRFVEILD